MKGIEIIKIIQTHNEFHYCSAFSLIGMTNFSCRFLELAVSDAKNVRKQQRMIIINAAIDGNAENVDYVLKYVELNLAKIIRL